MKVAIVNCTVEQGLRLTVEQRDKDRGLIGYAHFELQPGQNRVDPDFWAQWIAENATYSPVLSGHIAGAIVEDDGPPAVVEGYTMPAPVPFDATEPALAENDFHGAASDRAEPLPTATPESEIAASAAKSGPTFAPSIAAEDALDTQSSTAEHDEPLVPEAPGDEPEEH